MPLGHVEAVRLARENGHRVFLCTGRARSMISPSVLEIGFDGLVASAGGYVEIDGEVLHDRRFPAELAARTLSVLDEHDIAYVLEASEAIYGRDGVDERLLSILPPRRQSQTVGGPVSTGIFDLLVTPGDLSNRSFGKVTFFDSPIPLRHLAEKIGDEIDVLPSSIIGVTGASGELFMKGIDKAVGIATVIDRLGVAQEDVVAIGDSYNDLEMLAFAGTAVGIEGSPPEVLDLADLVVPRPAEEGVAVAFRELGLTDDEVPAEAAAS
ncbi:haloacid dehalogenase [Herbiconiux sp. L3-i23]|nr:haloacid dehalogenase [Herbiconiux sp. L3-i23]